MTKIIAVNGKDWGWANNANMYMLMSGVIMLTCYHNTYMLCYLNANMLCFNMLCYLTAMVRGDNANMLCYPTAKVQGDNANMLCYLTAKVRGDNANMLCYLTAKVQVTILTCYVILQC